MTIPRPEHPRPQFMRENWLNLNGRWEFEIDNAKIGIEKEFYKRASLDGEILVPFCPESTLSGVAHTDFMNCVWYRRDIAVPAEWQHKRILLHFGAVDYQAFVYINGIPVGEHKGGYTSFCFDITDALRDGANSLCVCAVDDNRSLDQPSGKQCHLLENFGCYYERTTGIWQTVWLEAVDAAYIQKTKYYPDAENVALDIELTLSPAAFGCIVEAQAFYEGQAVGRAETTAKGMSPRLHIDLAQKHLWEPGAGRLYDLKLTLRRDGKTLDAADSYFGLRSVNQLNKAFCINGKAVFGRWVLDQGYYPDGIYTAPDDDALRADVEYGLQLGFNGARLHEKVFEARFLYWADKLGYMVWGEHANWGYHADMATGDAFMTEWLESVERDFNHPSIVGWCPFNETWSKGINNEFVARVGTPQDKRMLRLTYRMTKAIDPTRPVIDTSGNFHCDETDIFDVHDYEQDPEKFKSYYDKIGEGILLDQVERNLSWKHLQKYHGGPVFVSEYGGARWDPDNPDGWGYGNAPQTEQEFIDRYRALTDILLDNPHIMGFCYTQLYDVAQERNGLMTYGRKFKFDPEIFRKINTRPAAIEKQPVE